MCDVRAVHDEYYLLFIHFLVLCEMGGSSDEKCYASVLQNADVQNPNIHNVNWPFSNFQNKNSKKINKRILFLVLVFGVNGVCG